MGVPMTVSTILRVPSFLIKVNVLVAGNCPDSKALPMEITASAVKKQTPSSSQVFPAGTTWPRTSFITIWGRADG